MYSINDLDLRKSCEQGFEFEVADDATGKGTGIFLTVIGSHAQSILDFTKKELDSRRVAEAIAEKRDPRGKNPQAKVIPIGNDFEFSTAVIALRVTGWRGISEPCSHENVVRLCTINPLIKEQILKVSDDLSNFPLIVPTN